MKYLKISLLILILSNPVILSQQEMMWDAKFALGGGFAGGWIFPDYDEINKVLPGFGVDKFSNSGFFTTGGLGHVSIAVIKNVRVGIMGFGGSVSNKAEDNGIKREAKYSASILGFTAEYTIPFIKTVAISAGTVIGAGNTTLELFQNSGNVDWDDIWQESGGLMVLDKNKKISNTFFTITPTLNFEYPINRFIVLRIGGGYIFALGENWELDNGQSISNVPSGMTSNAAFIQAGILIGYFNY